MKKALPTEQIAHKEPVNQKKDFPPHLGRKVVLDYLTEGKLDRGYKEGNIPTVSLQRAKTLLLEAGYTELALSSVYFGTHTDLKESKRWPQSPTEKFSVTFHGPSQYNLQQDITYDGVEALKYLVAYFGPDMPAEKDELRGYVLGQIAELEEIKKELHKAGKDWISLDKWIFTRDGEVRFWLNPWHQRENNFGYFTLDELRAWLNDDPNNPITKREEPQQRKRRRRPLVKYKGKTETPYQTELRQQLWKYSRGKTKDLRMLKILLMGCPFPDLVKRYSKKIK